jgi:hypothetical protein
MIASNTVAAECEGVNNLPVKTVNQSEKTVVGGKKEVSKGNDLLLAIDDMFEMQQKNSPNNKTSGG